MIEDNEYENRDSSILLRRVPRRLRTQFKILCIEQGRTVEESLINYMKYAVKTSEIITEEDLK